MKRLFYGLAIALVPLFGGFVGSIATSQPAPFKPPHNLTDDPSGKRVPVIGLPGGEKVETILHAEKIASQAGEDAIDWSVKSVGAPDAWAKGVTGKGVKVAVLDTAAGSSHRDLKDAIKGAKDFTGSGSTNDGHGHGSHCMGSIGARKNGWGIVGVAYNCDLYAGKVLSDQGSGRVDWIRDGIIYATQTWKVDVISMSIGGAGSDDYIPTGLKAAEDEGVIVVAAAGNDGNGRPVNYPAAYPFPIAISAIDSGLKLASFSCTGDKVEACGPGVNVRSCYPGPGDGLFADLSGTSMATPNVAGVAALWVEANQSIPKKQRPAAFKRWLAATAKDLGAKGRDANYGNGLPDASKAKSDSTDPVPTPLPPKDGISIDESDLNEQGKAKLRKGGFDKIRFDLVPSKSSDTQPPAPEKKARQLTLDEIGEELKTKESLIVFMHVAADLTKYPDAVECSDSPQEIPAGGYEAKLVTKIGLSPLK